MRIQNKIKLHFLLIDFRFLFSLTIVFLFTYLSIISLISSNENYLPKPITNNVSYISFSFALFISWYFSKHLIFYKSINNRLFDLLITINNPPFRGYDKKQMLSLAVINEYAQSNEYVQHVLGLIPLQISHTFDSSDIYLLNQTRYPNDFDENKFIYKKLQRYGRLKKRNWNYFNDLLDEIDVLIIEFLPDDIKNQFPKEVYNVRYNALWRIVNLVIKGYDNILYKIVENVEDENDSDKYIYSFLNIVYQYYLRKDIKNENGKIESIADYKKRKMDEVNQSNLLLCFKN